MAESRSPQTLQTGSSPGYLCSGSPECPSAGGRCSRSHIWRRAERPVLAGNEQEPGSEQKMRRHTGRAARNKKRRSASEDSVLLGQERLHGTAAGWRKLIHFGHPRKGATELRQVQPNRPAQEQPAVFRKNRGRKCSTQARSSRAKAVQGKRQRPKRMCLQSSDLDATKESRTVNESDENTLDYDALSGYIDELKTKLDETNGGGGVVGTKKPRRQVTSNASRKQWHQRPNPRHLHPSAASN